MAPGERRSGTPRQLPDLEVCYYAFQLRARGQGLRPLTPVLLSAPRERVQAPPLGLCCPGPCSWECVDVSDCLCRVHWVISNSKDGSITRQGLNPSSPSGLYQLTSALRHLPPRPTPGMPAAETLLP